MAVGTWGTGQPLTLVALVVAFGILGARIIVPGVITAQMLRQLARREPKEPDWKDLFGVYQTTLIIKAAMLEGATFLLLIMHMRGAFALDADSGRSVPADTPDAHAHLAPRGRLDRAAIAGRKRDAVESREALYPRQDSNLRPMD